MTSRTDETTSSVEAYPIAVIQDRYGGWYSGGAWIAMSVADRLENGAYRIVRCLEGGPNDEDVEARFFWDDPPDWIAVGATPNEAVAALKRKMGIRSDDVILAEIDRKIEEGRADLEAGRTSFIEEIRAEMSRRYGRPAAAE